MTKTELLADLRNREGNAHQITGQMNTPALRDLAASHRGLITTLIEYFEDTGEE
jgi:hypothetical protein